MVQNTHFIFRTVVFIYIQSNKTYAQALGIKQVILPIDPIKKKEFRSQESEFSMNWSPTRG